VAGLLQVAVPNHLGDAVMALEPLRRLCAALPRFEIRLVGRRLPALVLDGQGPWGTVSSTWFRQSGSSALLLAPSFRVAGQAFWSGARVRIGTPTDWRRLLLTDVVDISVRTHHQRVVFAQAVDRAVEILGRGTQSGVALGAVAFETDPSGREWWEGVGRPEVLLHPWAAGSPRKRWPMERWIELAKSFATVAVTGGPSGEDARFAQSLSAALGAPCAAGSSALTPRAWASLAQAVPKLVLPDTGLAHLASEVGARPVVLFGATNPALYAPKDAEVVVAPSMSELQVDAVLRTLDIASMRAGSVS
jgi:ADP-heptose:LPS heptosyltransferase